MDHSNYKNLGEELDPEKTHDLKSAASEQPPPLLIPLVGAPVQAGFPAAADEFIEDRLDLNRYLITQPAATFFIRVQGSSMEGSGIFPGDILVVDRSLEPKEKDIVIAIIDGQFTLKRFRRIGGVIHLCPENPQFISIRIESDQVEFAIWGVVSAVVRKLRK